MKKEKNKNFKMDKNVVERVLRAGKYTLVSGLVLVMLTGCGPIFKKEVSTNSNTTYDSIDTTDNDLITTGIEQILDVPNEDFKLSVSYKCVLKDNEKWTVTDDKQIYTEISTKGLKEGYQVYIDNVHTDTTIRSIYPSVDGITQDSMDDRLHGEQLLGFPISDANAYGNINCIEGQNDTFIKGSFSGFKGYSYGTVSEKRFVESDYLDAGVFANKISSVIDLIIVKPDGTITCTSVPSTIQVSVWPYIEEIDKKGNSYYTLYVIDKNLGNVTKTEVSADDYEEVNQTGKGSK